MRGKIIKGIAGFYYCFAGDGNIYACKARGIFRKDGRKPLVGDDVRLVVVDEKDMEGNVEELLPRKNALIRPAVANVDQAFVVFSVDSPKPNFLLLDRFLVMMEREHIPAVICFNKIDLLPEARDVLREIYKGSGCSVIFTSTLTGEGLPEARKLLKGKTTVTAGPSGVGKSSLSNYFQEDIHMETGEISRKLGRGRHTTRHSQIIPVGIDTFLVDTPGFSSLFLENMEEQELPQYFPEFRPFAEYCRFQGCRHIHEPDCAVKEALSEQRIHAKRYENYLALHEELLSRRRY